MPNQHRFFASVSKGLEEPLVEELKELGLAGVQAGRAGVYFEGDLKAGYRACLWSRIANRILLPLKTFPAPSPEKLYGGVKSIRWSDHIDPGKTIAVDFASTHSQITHTHFGALKTKDAICDQMRSVKGARPSVKIDEPDLRINVYVNQDQATVSIDLSGESLHRRGYRDERVPAPMKETLAAGLLRVAGWQKIASQGGGLVDPMCGGGTLAVEAAWIAARIAPSSKRRHFGFLNWLAHDSRAWSELLEEAKDLEIRDPKQLPRIAGYDQDSRAIRAAIQSANYAGVQSWVHFEKRDLSLAEAVPTRAAEPAGLIVVNPPYGERLGEVEELKPLYRQLGDVFKQRFKGWEGWVLTGSSELSKEVGLKAARRFVVFNGPIECRWLRFPLY